MADVSRISSLEEDPLHSYSGLTLFPRTLKSMSIPLPSPLYQSDDLKQTHTLLQSLPFEIQNEHQEQTKAILEDTGVGVKLNLIPNKRERRPGLDRERKKFSLKLTASEPPPVAPSFDGSKYPNPEDYFAEYDIFENANREWQKQTGFDGSKYPNPKDYFAEYDKFENANREWQKQTESSVISTQQNPPSRRPRRPEIPGTKRGSYKHTYTDSYFTNALNLEAPEKETPIPSEQSFEKTTTAHVKTADREVDNSTVDTSKDLESILSELLACDANELEGDSVVKLLEDPLQIKSFNVEKLYIPEFQDVEKTVFKASGRNASNRKSVLTDIQNTLDGINRDALQKNSLPPYPLTKKHFSSSNPPENQFSFPDIHNLLPVPGDKQSNEPLTNNLNVQPLANHLNISSSSSVTKDANKDVTNRSPSNVDTVDIASPFSSSVQKSSNEDDSDTHHGLHRSSSSPDEFSDNITNRNSAMLHVNVDMQTKGKEGDVPMTESGANKNTDGRKSNADINEETDQLERLAEYAPREVTRPFTVEEDSIPYQQDIVLTTGACSKSPNRAPEQYNTMDGSFEHAEHIQGQDLEENDNTDSASGPLVENAQEVHNSSQKQISKRRKRGSSDSNMKKRSKTVHGETGGDKQHESEPNKQTKIKAKEREVKNQKKTVTREGKMFSSRKSLAGAGTKIEGGLRRSTRLSLNH